MFLKARGGVNTEEKYNIWQSNAFNEIITEYVICYNNILLDTVCVYNHT